MLIPRDAGEGNRPAEQLRISLAEEATDGITVGSMALGMPSAARIACLDPDRLCPARLLQVAAEVSRAPALPDERR